MGCNLEKSIPKRVRIHERLMAGRSALPPRRAVPCGVLPSDYAKAIGFRSVLSMRKHIYGKIEHAGRIEPHFASKIADTLSKVNWLL